MKIEILIKETCETHNSEKQIYEKVQVTIEGTKEECFEALDKIKHHLYIKD